MLNDTERTLAYLLSDANLPECITRQILDYLLGNITAETGEDTLEQSWRYLLRPESKDFLLAGPVFFKDNRSIDVSRVVKFSTFVRYFAPSLGISFRIRADMERLHTKIRDEGGLYIPAGHVAWASANHSVWTTLPGELERVDKHQIAENLGWFKTFQDEDLLSITYTIPSGELRVPTIADACLDPGFVPKPTDHTELPRAWNWRAGSWGLPEFVHRPLSLTGKAIVRYVGRYLGTQNGPAPNDYNFNSYAIASATELENAVKEILLQATAQRGLRSFATEEARMHELAPREFEAFLGLLFQRAGFSVTVTKATRDGGVDIIAVRNNQSSQGLLIQAKKTEGKVGISVIRELIGARFLGPAVYSGYMLVVATTGRFSLPALEAQALFPGEILLLDYKALTSELLNYKSIGINDLLEKAMGIRKRYANALTQQGGG